MTHIQKAGDKMAIFLSSLCVIHCLITPILIIALPSLGSMFASNHEIFHKVLLFFVLPVGLVALYAGYRHHQSAKVFAVGVVGLSLLTFAAFFVHERWGELAETVLTVFASIIIVIAHLMNFRLRQRADSGEKIPC